MPRRHHCELVRRVAHCGGLTIAALVLSGLMSARADEDLNAAVRACATLGDDGERLACYDRTVAPRVPPGSAEAAPPRAEEMFGIDATTPSPRAEAAPARAGLSAISARVVSAEKVGHGMQITLDNGQVWRTEDDRDPLVKPDEIVTISRATLGTFRLTTQAHRAARVKRVR